MKESEIRKNSIIFKGSTYDSVAGIKDALRKKFPNMPDVFSTTNTVMIDGSVPITGMKMNENIDFMCEYIYDIIHNEEFAKVAFGEIVFVVTYVEKDNLVVSTVGVLEPDLNLPAGTFLSPETGTA